MIRFTRSEFWRDYHGKHSCTEVFCGKVRIGQISGESGSAIPIMRYFVEVEKLPARNFFSLKEAKDYIRKESKQ